MLLYFICHSKQHIHHSDCLQ